MRVSSKVNTGTATRILSSMLRFYIPLLFITSAFAQTNLTSPVTVLPTSGRAATGSLLFRDKQSAYHSVGFQAPASIGANTVWQLPSADAAGCLISNGSLVLSFAPCSGSPGATAAFGAFGELQNFLLDSETIGGTGWSLVNSESAVQGATLSPNNVSVTGAKLINGGVAAGAAIQTITLGALATNYNLSVWAEAGTSSQIGLGIYDTTASAWLAGNPQTLPLSGSWSRVSVSGTATAGHTLTAYIFADGPASTGSLYNFVWGAQVDTGSTGTPFSYMRTDNASWSGTFDPWAQISPFAGAAVNGNLVQTSAGGANWFSAPSTFNGEILATGPTVSFHATQGYVQSDAGFLSAYPGGTWQGFGSNTDGALLRGYGVASSALNTQTGTATASGSTLTCATNCPFPTSPTLTGSGILFDGVYYFVTGEAGGGASVNVNGTPPAGTFAYVTQGTTGGYVNFAPIFYPPVAGEACFDAFGNAVSQPVPLNGLSAFGSEDVILWNSTSPSQGYHAPFTVVGGVVYFTTGTPCGSPIPVPPGAPYGLNINSYIFSNQGFASGAQAFNAIEAFNGGGITGQAFTAAGVYTAGTQTRAGFTVNPFDLHTTLDGSGRISNQYGTFLGGYIYTGYADQNPGGPSGTCTSIGVCDNPLIVGETLAPGEISYNTTLGCEVVYNGTSWGCIGSNYWTLSGTNLYPASTSYKLLVGENSNISGAQLEVAGAIETIGANSPIGSASTGTNIAFQANSGTFQVNGNGAVSGNDRFATNQSFDPKATTCTSLTSPSSGYGGLGFQSGAVYCYWNGSTWNTLDFSATGAWTLSGTNLYPASTSDKVLVGETSNISGAQLEVAGSIETIGANSPIGSASTGTNIAFQANSGAFQVNGNGAVSGNDRFATNQSFDPKATTCTSLTSPTGGYGGLGYQSSTTYCYWTGSAWSTIDLAAVSSWTLSGSNLYPASTGYSVLVGETSNVSGAKFEVAGSIETIGANSPIGSASTGTNIAFQANSGTFQVNGNGAVSGNGIFASNQSFDPKATTCTSLTNPTGGYGGLGYQSTSNYCYWNGSGWAVIDFSSVGSSQWTLSGSLLYPNSTGYKVLVGRTTDDGSSAPLQVASIGTCVGSTTCSVHTAATVSVAATTTALAFQVDGGSFLVNGYGDISSGGSVNALGNATLSLCPYRVNGTCVIDASRNANLGTAVVATVQASSYIQPGSFTFAGLPTTSAGRMVYCSDCISAVGTCTSGGNGAMAFYDSTATWKCF